MKFIYHIYQYNIHHFFSSDILKFCSSNSVTHIITALSSRQAFESSLGPDNLSKLSANVKIVQIGWVSECLLKGRLFDPTSQHLLVADRKSSPASSASVTSNTVPTISNLSSSIGSRSSSSSNTTTNEKTLSLQQSDYSDLEYDPDIEPDPGPDPTVSYPSNVPSYACQRRSPYDSPNKKIIDALETLIDFCHFQQGLTTRLSLFSLDFSIDYLVVLFFN